MEVFQLTKITISISFYTLSSSQHTYTVTQEAKQNFKAKCDLYLQAMYNEFSTANIQIDKDFSAKLSGYGCVGQIPTTETEISNNSVVSSCFL